MVLERLRRGKKTGLSHISVLHEANARKGSFEREQFEAVLKHMAEALRVRIARLNWERPCEVYLNIPEELLHLVITGVRNSYNNLGWNMQPDKLRANTMNPQPKLAE